MPIIQTKNQYKFIQFIQKSQGGKDKRKKCYNIKTNKAKENLKENIEDSPLIT